MYSCAYLPYIHILYFKEPQFYERYEVKTDSLRQDADLNRNF